MDSSPPQRNEPPGGRASSPPTSSETIAGVVTLASWFGVFLAFSGRLTLGRAPELGLAVLAGLSTLVTFVVSSRRHAPAPRPRSFVGRLVVWTVILAAIAGIGYLVFLAVVLPRG